ncbi:MAG: S1 RNA-binding domain-containing protein [Acidobacteriota bacterium]
MPENPADSSFGDILSEFEQSHHKSAGTLEGTVVSVTPDAVFVDIGRKTDGLLPPDPSGTLKPGVKVIVSIRGRDDEGNLLLSTIKVEIPKDWSGLEAAFANKSTISGTVLEAIKGGLRVDVGVRAFMPASRSGVREIADLEKLVGQQIECRITKLDTASEDVVVDRRVVLEEQEKITKQVAFDRIEEGAVIHGAVRSLTDFGAFVDLGGVDGLLHISDMTYSRGAKPSDVVKIGDGINVLILKVNKEKHKISLGLKQLQPDPWTVAAEKYQQGMRIKGKVARVADFGAFVELEPGLEGLIHVSEMSWTKRNVKASDVVKEGDLVDVVILGVNPADKRVALGLKQALGDPWEEAARKYPVGAIAEAPVTSLAQFGAFIELGEGIEGMIHIGDITGEKRLNHPNELLKVGQVVKAIVTEADKARRRIRLSMKALEPTSTDDYLAEHKVGEVVTGRIVDASGKRIKVELGEGVIAFAALPEVKKEAAAATTQKVDLSALTSMLTQKWKTGGGAGEASEPDKLRTGQIRSFKIAAIDAEKKKIELELQP